DLSEAVDLPGVRALVLLEHRAADAPRIPPNHKGQRVRVALADKRLQRLFARERGDSSGRDDRRSWLLGQRGGSAHPPAPDFSRSRAFLSSAVRWRPAWRIAIRSALAV